MLIAAQSLGADISAAARERRRRRQFHFDPVLKLMSTVDERDGDLWIDAKGAPEALLPRCAAVASSSGQVPLSEDRRAEISRVVADYAAQGLRVLGVGQRPLESTDVPEKREEAERDLCFLGLVAMLDPPRPEVAQCHAAGIRIIVVTGDHGLTAAAVAQQVGIGDAQPTVVTGEQLAAMTEPELDTLLRDGRELIFARTSPYIFAHTTPE
jgi:magnesium-transporting ATPase (P-type)